MSCRHAVFLDLHPLNAGGLDLSPLHAVFDKLTCHEHSAPQEVIARLQGASVAIVNKVSLTQEVMDACPELRLILVAATGLNNIDLGAAHKHKITVCNCQGYGTETVAQHTLMLILALATQLPSYQRAVQAGDWQNSNSFCLLNFPIMELSGKTLGILGHGTLGQAVERLARAFGMEVMIGTLPGRPVQTDHLPWKGILPQADVLTLHCPLTDKTRGLLGAEELALMKPGALLINTARGGIVDEQALADALRNGTLGGAGVDVLESEPPTANHPLLAPDIPNLILTPHSAWGSREARQRIVLQLVENAAAFFAGKPVRQV